MRLLIVFLFLTALVCHAYSQKQVSITIDDVPNSNLYIQAGYRDRLLEKIDSMKLPVAIFINEFQVLNSGHPGRSMALFNDWIRSPQVTVGHHGYHHAMYSDAGIDSFRIEILKGDVLSKQLAAKYGKTEKYFRFPYNDLGKDADAHNAAATFLKSRGYIVTPYTVHSDDWLVTELYAYYKKNNRPADAKRVGDAFIRFTLDNFDYAEMLTSQKADRAVKQIYLMHDNQLNADYMDVLVAALRKKGYKFITLEDAMTDPVYQQTDYYKERHGISWIYRWISDVDQRKKLMRAAPAGDSFEQELSRVQPK